MKKLNLVFLSLIIFFQGINLFSSKIISLAPGITEIIFKLEKGDELVGVTRFCDFPPRAKLIQNIGGLVDLNIEQIISLKPNIIFCYPEHMERISILRNRAKLIFVPHRTIHDLYRSIEIISVELGIASRGITLVTSIKKSLSAINNNTSGKIPKVMIVAARDPSSLKSITIVGSGDYLNELLEISGGRNCYRGKLYYPSVSLESVIKMNPDIIIEFSFFFKKNSKREIIEQWRKYPGINAVKNNKIFVIKDQFWLRPGPRVVQAAENLKKIIFDVME